MPHLPLLRRLLRRAFRPASIKAFAIVAVTAVSLGVQGEAFLSTAAHAVNPNERLADPKLEARARALSQELRCLVCQNQSIDDSNADLAHDLRVVLRERLQKGDSDQQVLDYLTSRYGDFVLLKPPLKPETWPLWFGPPILLVLAGIVILAIARRRQQAATPAGPLSAEERQRVDELLRHEEG